MTVTQRLKTLLGVGEYPTVTVIAGAVLTLIGLITGLVFGIPGLIFTSVLIIMGLFVVSVVTSPRRRGDSDGGDGVPPHQPPTAP